MPSQIKPGDSGFAALVMLLMALGAVLLWLAGLLFQWCLWTAFGKDIPFVADVAAGMVTSPALVPVAVLCWVVRLCGVPVPFFRIG